MHATRVGGAARGGAASVLMLPLALLATLGCASELMRETATAFPAATGVAVYTAPAPSQEERYCAWYGTEGPDDVLYFGEAAFWSAKASAGGDPSGDLEHRGPQLVGRFDLARERWLPPLDVGEPESRSGVWDVFAAEGEVYFTTFFEEAGSVSPATGRVRRLALGRALNEFGAGPNGTVLATRYGSGSADGGNGDAIAFDRDGHTIRRWPLIAPPGDRVAPKTPLWDDLREELWITTDQLPVNAPATGPLRATHEAIRVDARGAQLLPEPPELMFLAKSRDGTIYRAELSGRDLGLQVVPPPGRGEPHRVALDSAFAHELDFVQDIQVAADGRVAVTRWSGTVHVLHPDGRLSTVALPRPDPSGLYYTGVLHGDRMCVTYCADVTVVCVDAP